MADAKDPSVIRSGNRQDIILAVHSAWAATLPWAPIEIEKSWSDIGVDSLKALEFILRLERSLGIRVSFDAMTPELYGVRSHSTVGRRSRRAPEA